MDKQTAIGIIERAIELLGPVPADEWITYYFTNESSVCCVIGHFTRLTSDAPTNYSVENCRDFGIKESRSLRLACRYLLGTPSYSLDIADVNNGDDPNYQQERPKDRVMQALQDVLDKAKEESNENRAN